MAANEVASVRVRRTVAADVGQQDDHEGRDYAP
jgi:hypothetical protein